MPHKQSEELTDALRARIKELEQQLVAQEDVLELLRRNESIFNTAQQIANVGSWRIDVREGNMYLSPTMCRIHGVEQNVISLQDALELTHESARAKAEAAVKSALDGNPPAFEYNLTKPDGEIRTLYAPSAQLVRDDDGNIIELIGVIQDITEQRRIESSLRQSEEKLRATLASMEDLVFVIDKNNVFKEFYQPTDDRTLYAEPKDFLGKPFVDILPLEVAKLLTQAIHTTKATHEASRYEYLLGIGGKQHWFQAIVTGLKSDSGEFDGVVAVARDITDWRQTENELVMKSLLLDQMNDHVTITDFDGVITYVNQAQAQAIGISKEKLIGLTTDIFGGDAERGATQKEIVAQTIRDGYMRSEVVNYTAGGHEQIMDCRTQVLRDSNGTPIALCGIATDITDRKQMEIALRESDKNFRAFFQTVDDLIAISMLDGHIIQTNDMMKRELGYDEAELKKMRIPDLHPIEFNQEAENIFESILKGKSNQCPLPLLKKNGEYLSVDTRAKLGKWNGSDCVFHISKDISVRQAALDKFRRIFDRNPALMAVNSIPERRFVDVNEAFLNCLGFTRAEVIGKTTEDLNSFPDQAAQARIADELQSQGHIADVEVKVRTKDGKLLDGLFSGEIIENQDQKMFLTVMIDQTERKQAEEALRQSQERLRSQFDNLPLPTYLWKHVDGSFYLVDYNKAAFEVTQGRIDHIKDKSSDELFKNDLEIREALLRCYTFKTSEKVEYLYTYKSTEVSRYLLSSVIYVPPDYVMVHSEDITDRYLAEKARHKIERLEKQSLETEKLAATGRMVARIAHEINNPLAGIKNSFMLIKDLIPQDHKHYPFAARIDREIDRLSRMTRQMIGLHQSRSESASTFQLEACLRDIISLVEAGSQNREVQITLEMRDPPLSVYMNDDWLRQILFNVIQNAVEASPQHGIVKIETSVKNKLLSIMVYDQGPGFPPGIESRIYEPFFTTKSNTRTGGMGLGLPISKGLVDAMNGSISFWNHSEGGAVFQIDLPFNKEAKEQHND